MADWVADKAGTKLVAQINMIAPNRSKASDGTIGDPDHQARESAHNPEDSEDADAPGNPDNQVDARDITHDPSHGCDIGVIFENIRVSHDMRARHVIFNRRQFSNRTVGGVPAFTWRPYSGKNPHTGHGHIEIDDRYHDQTHDWKITMADVPQYTQNAILYTDNRVSAFTQGQDKVVGTEAAPQGKGQPMWPVVTLKGIVATLAEIKAAVSAPKPPATVVMTDADREAIAKRTSELVVAELRALQFVAQKP